MKTTVIPTLALIGALVLVSALRNIHRIRAEIPTNRGWWAVIEGGVVLFIAGYIAYAYSYAYGVYRFNDIVTTVVFLGGALFVLLISHISHQAIEFLRQMATLEREAITDPLMEIYNRRYLDRKLDDEVARAHRYRTALSVLLLDIDHFKRVNDTYGHDLGDRVLVRIGDYLKRSVRRSDILGRYGGEELLLILPQTGRHRALALAEKLRRGIEATEVLGPHETRDSIPLHCTVSIGVASFGTGVDTPERLLKSVDEALYRAKAEGRNRVCGRSSRRPRTPGHAPGISRVRGLGEMALT